VLSAVPTENLLVVHGRDKYELCLEAAIATSAHGVKLLATKQSDNLENYEKQKCKHFVTRYYDRNRSLYIKSAHHLQTTHFGGYINV
jgi:hypothetical protein